MAWIVVRLLFLGGRGAHSVCSQKVSAAKLLAGRAVYFFKSVYKDLKMASRLPTAQALRGHAALVAGQSPGQGPSPAKARRHMLMADAAAIDGCAEGDSDLCR